MALGSGLVDFDVVKGGGKERGLFLRFESRIIKAKKVKYTENEDSPTNKQVSSEVQ